MSNVAMSAMERELTKLKKRLERIVAKNQYDLQHPEVIAASRRLDQVIVRMMATSR